MTPTGGRKHPCQGKCTPSEKVCRGCRRTEEEIRDWNSYSEEKKKQLMEELPLRPLGDYTQ